MRESTIQSLKLQLEEVVQMLRLVASEKRTCMEIREWLDRNYPDTEDTDNSRPIVTMLLKTKDEKTK
jgi:hypothetical protein